MGCDIHAHVEIKVRGKWLHYNHPSIGRWYELFGKMAGVRDEDVEPVAKQRGLPKDITLTTRLDRRHWGVDMGITTPGSLGRKSS